MLLNKILGRIVAGIALALALSGLARAQAAPTWNLLAPPTTSGVGVPLSQWQSIGGFDSNAACEREHSVILGMTAKQAADMGALPPGTTESEWIEHKNAMMCLATNDPRLAQQPSSAPQQATQETTEQPQAVPPGTWFLMAPHQGADGKVHPEAPFSAWDRIMNFAGPEACEAVRRKVVQDHSAGTPEFVDRKNMSVCISADDPRIPK